MKTPHKRILIEISAGELVDRITILQIKAERFAGAQKRRNVAKELAKLKRVAKGAIERTEAMIRLIAELKGVNEMLWRTEDELRGCEQTGKFGAKFVALARSVYLLNDRRFELKRHVSDISVSRVVEEKQYESSR